MITYTLIEYMPAFLRASHVAANNSGVYPANGAERAYVQGLITSDMLDPTWAKVIEDGIRDVPEGELGWVDIPDDAMRSVSDLDEGDLG